MKTYIGADNGVSAYWTIMHSDGFIVQWHVPVKKELNYTKVKAWLNRIDAPKLHTLLKSITATEALVLLERPMVNPTRFKASVSAIRALEATLIVLENLKLPYRYVDSKEWQHSLLPGNVASDELKEAANQVARRLFPNTQFKEGDSLLMAEWARRQNL